MQLFSPQTFQIATIERIPAKFLGAGQCSARWIIIAAIVLCATGCGDGRPELVPVSGQVLIDGEPLKFGSIRFVPTGARSSSAELDEEGRFTLTCYEDNDGAVIGRHRVSVSAGETLNEVQIRWHAPKKYAKYKSSELEEEITEATTTITINLTWDGRKPYVQGSSSSQSEQEPDDGD